MKREVEIVCTDCGMPYLEFPLDVVLLDEEWAMLVSGDKEEVILCANCIVERASKLPGIIGVGIRFDFGKSRCKEECLRDRQESI